MSKFTDDDLKRMEAQIARNRLVRCVHESTVLWDMMTPFFCPIASVLVEEEARKALAELGGMAGEW